MRIRGRHILLVYAVGAAVALPLPTRAQQRASASDPAAALVVADFGAATRTQQGGQFRVVGGRPDVVRDCFAQLGEPAAWAWRIDVLAGAPATGVGAVVPLFDDGARRIELTARDLSATPFLELTLCGTLGDRTLRIEVNPTAVNDPEAAGPTVASIAAAQISAEAWRPIYVRIPSATAGVVRLMLDGDGPAWLAVDRMRFCATDKPGPWPPATLTPPHPLSTAMWLWTPEQDLGDETHSRELLELCRTQGLTDLFVQMPYEFTAGVVTVTMPDRLRAFNAAARRAGVRVHALDGNPSYVLPENHARMFALVAALDRFNQDSPAEARFDALHLDNEPYILPQWKNAPTRPPVVAAYVELNRELRRRANAAGMELGLDIPFWFDKRNPDGTPTFAVETPRGPVTLLEALFDGIAQNVGVMSYRERVTGANGVVGVCRDEFELATRYNVVVFTSVELGTGPRVEKGITFGPYPKAYFASQLATLRHVLEHEPGCRGLAIHCHRSFRELEQRP